jgi:hypothetical protein
MDMGMQPTKPMRNPAPNIISIFQPLGGLQTSSNPGRCAGNDDCSGGKSASL